ncbi:MAG TPA: cytidine deaminase [Rectinemataceae bacterium]|nr:cytidine deaminase [Rectinemataceae bacterium]
MDTDELFRIAEVAARASYSPYSHFRVGAALVAEDGTIITGTNVENRSFGLTICAERSAIVAAVTAGHRRFTKLVIATPDADYPVSPCGACRQVLSEFLEAGAPVFFGSKAGNLVSSTVGELFPHDALHELSR